MLLEEICENKNGEKTIYFEGPKRCLFLAFLNTSAPWRQLQTSTNFQKNSCFILNLLCN